MKNLWSLCLINGVGILYALSTWAQTPTLTTPTPPEPESAQTGPPHTAPILQEILPEPVPLFGVEVEPEIVTLPTDIRAESANMTGVKVRRVLPNTMAAQVGLQPGDIIYKINNRRIKSFDDILDIMTEMTPTKPGRVDFVRDRATFIRDFRPDQTYNKEVCIPLLASCRETRYATRLDVAGGLCNAKESKGSDLGSFTFLGPLLLEYRKAGGHQTVTTLFLLKFPKGKPGPVVF